MTYVVLVAIPAIIVAVIFSVGHVESANDLSLWVAQAIGPPPVAQIDPDTISASGAAVSESFQPRAPDDLVESVGDLADPGFIFDLF